MMVLVMMVVNLDQVPERVRHLVGVDEEMGVAVVAFSDERYARDICDEVTQELYDQGIKYALLEPGKVEL